MAATPTGELAGIARDLYGLPPGEFTAARNERAARAKREGDAELATAVRALTKPAMSAWVVNLMVRQLPERVGDLVALGEELRSAQDEMDAGTLRALTAQRRKLTATVAREGGALAAELGQKVTAVVTEQVQATLHAAMTDERAAAAVRTGLLLGPLAATGLDDVDLTDAVALPVDDAGVPDTAARKTSPPPTDLSARRASARARAAKEVTDSKAELAVAEAAASKTGKVLRAKKDKVRTLQAQVLQLRAELDELLREVSALEDRLEPVTAGLQQAQDAVADADAMDVAARAAVERAEHRLSRARAAAGR